MSQHALEFGGCGQRDYSYHCYVHTDSVMPCWQCCAVDIIDYVNIVDNVQSGMYH